MRIAIGLLPGWLAMIGPASAADLEPILHL